MPSKQGDLSLLNDPVAQTLLQSTIPARFAYTWKDGTPRVVPIWFYWTGEVIVLGSPSRSPKFKALHQGSPVALTIDSNEWPYKVLSIRGTVAIEHNDDVVPEYEAAAKRYFGEEGGQAWVAQARTLIQGMERITIRPTWVGILDMETRYPSALSG